MVATVEVMTFLGLLAAIAALPQLDAFAPSSTSSRSYVSVKPSSAGAFSSPLFRSRPAAAKQGWENEQSLHVLFMSGTASAKDGVSSKTETSDESSSVPADGPQLGAWIPLGSASSLAGLTPVQIKVCGLDLAVWHKPLPADAKKHDIPAEWSVMVDACPHRLAPLSQGRVDPDTGCIECPYHGWAFDTKGELKVLPQLDEGRTIEAATGGNGAATTLPTHRAGDLLFVFIPSDVCGDSWPISRLPEQHYPYLQADIEAGTTYYARDLPYSMDFLLENFLDPAHIPYAHHSLQGTRDDGSPIAMKVLESNFTHVETTFLDICRGKQRDGVLSFQRPAFYHFRTRANETAEFKPNLKIYVAPIKSGCCRVIMPDFKMVPFLPTWLGHAATNRFLNTDTWLHDTERAARMDKDHINKKGGSVAVGAARAGKVASGDLNYIFASRADLGPSTYRKWWSTHGHADAPPNTFGPASADDLPSQALTRAEQIDPWVHHAKHCAKCRRALGWMRKLRKASAVAAAVGAVLLRNKPPLAIAGVLVGLWTYNFLRKFSTVIEGNPNQSQILDRSVAASN